MDTSAVMGFTNSLFNLINRERPNYLAVAFDKGGSVDRSEIYTEYKANRPETPEAIRIAVPYIQALLEAMNIPIIEKEGYEADDIIGTLAKQAENEGFDVYMMTPDKDFAQLVSPNIFMYLPSRKGNGIEIWGVKEVQEKFDIEHPDQVIDYLGMMGDSVDNIPGLPGVGDKTAKKFIKQYGSLENLLQNAHEVTGKLGEKILDNKELGVLSKKLAKIILDVPIDYNLDEFKLSDPDKDIVLKVFDELEFRRIKETFFKIFGTNSSQLEKKGAEVVQGDLFSETYNLDSNKENLDESKSIYQIIESFEELKLLVEKMMEQELSLIHI